MEKGRVLPKLYEKIANMGPGSGNPHDEFRDAIIDIHLRLSNIERNQMILLKAIQKELLAIAEHAPNTLGAIAAISLQNMED